MMYLLSKIVLYLLGSFALGFVLAWLAWRAAWTRRERDMTSRWERKLGDLQRERDTSMAKLRREVEDHRQQIPTLEKSLADRSDLIARLEADLGDWRGKLPDLEERLRERDAKVEELTAELSGEQQRVEARTRDLEAARDELEREREARTRHDREAAKAVDELRAQERSAHTRIEEQDAEIRRLGTAAASARSAQEASQRELRELRERLDQEEAARAELATRLEEAERGATGDLFAAAPIGSAPAGLLEAPPADSRADDLKQIRGIGPVLEQTLNRLGIYFFAQLAALGTEEVAWVAHHLNTFPGRISRDRWVEQAAQLHAAKHGDAGV